MNSPVLSFVIPCLNESATLASVIQDCRSGGEALKQDYEILVADNGSTDGSQTIARELRATVIDVPIRGYGAALIAGIQAAKGTYVLMGDADSTYDFRQAPQFVEKLYEGYDLVMGNRFKGGIEPNAMPFLHRYLGNPVLSSLGRLFFGISVGDFHCGLRAFDRLSINSLHLRCKGMEFASEMVIKASISDLAMAEIPVHLRPNPPGRSPHLKTWRDGWRHLKFMLSFTPKYSLLLVAVFLLGLAVSFASAFAMQVIPFTGPNTMVFAASCTIAAMSIISDYVLAREMFYRRFERHRTKSKALWLDSLLGLGKGTDRLFKVAAAFLAVALVGFGSLIRFGLTGTLGSSLATMAGFVGCASMFASISLYLTATKITTYRSIHE